MKSRNRTFKIALGGICLALAVIFMFGASFVPGIELTLFLISSLFTAIMVIETGVGGGLMVYAGASLLGLLLIPNKLALVPYVFCFGYYAVLKYFIEKIKSGLLQIIIKIIYSAALMSVGILLFRSVLAQGVHLPDYPSAVLIIAGTVFMLIYDYAMTFLINWYMRRFKGDGSDSLTLS